MSPKTTWGASDVLGLGIFAFGPPQATGALPIGKSAPGRTLGIGAQTRPQHGVSAERVIPGTAW